MRVATAALKNLIEAWGPLSDIAMVDLYSFILVGGEVLRYSGWSSSLRAPAPGTDSPLFTYQAGPLFQRGKCEIKVGTEVDNLDFEIYTHEDTEVTIGGVLTWQKAVWEGLFDGAYLELQRAYVANSNSSTPSVVGTLTWFYGRIADIEIGRTTVKVKVKSELDRLTIQMPRRLFQASCTFVFGDAMCLFDRESMAQDITADSGTDQNSIATSLAPSPSTLFDNGTVISTSGENNGFSRTIARLTGGVIYFLKPWVFAIGPGDTFHLLPGCDHTLDTCRNTFNNDIHFGGFSYIPPPETAV